MPEKDRRGLHLLCGELSSTITVNKRESGTHKSRNLYKRLDLIAKSNIALIKSSSMDLACSRFVPSQQGFFPFLIPPRIALPFQEEWIVTANIELLKLSSFFY